MKRFIAPTICLLAIALSSAGCGRSNQVLGPGHEQAGRSAALTTAGAPAGIPAQTVALVAGQTKEIGSVSVWLDQGRLAVQYETQASWVLDATHLAVAASIGGIPVNNSGNPVVGHFPNTQSHSPGVTQYTYYIDLAAAGLENEPMLELAAQADVSLLSGTGDVTQREGAWARGEPFDPVLMSGRPGKGQGGNWAMHFAVDMNQLRGLLLWNKLGSRDEVEHSVVGPNGVITGDITYLACEYGNGFKAMPRTGDHNIPNNFVEFPNLNLGPKGCIEFWFLPDWTDWQVGKVVDVLWYAVPGTSPLVNYLAMGYNDWQEMMNFGAGNDSNNGLQWSIVPGSTPGWSTTVPFHVAITWEGTLPSVPDRLQVYLNGTRVGFLMANTGNPTFTNWQASAVLRLASRFNSGDWNRHNWDADHMVIDNVKIWSYPKRDFSDRFHE